MLLGLALVIVLLSLLLTVLIGEQEVRGVPTLASCDSSNVSTD